MEMKSLRIAMDLLIQILNLVMMVHCMIFLVEEKSKNIDDTANKDAQELGQERKADACIIENESEQANTKKLVKEKKAECPSEKKCKKSSVRGGVIGTHKKWIDDKFKEDLVDVKMAQIVPEDGLHDSDKLFEDSHSSVDEKELLVGIKDIRSSIRFKKGMIHNSKLV